MFNWHFGRRTLMFSRVRSMWSFEVPKIEWTETKNEKPNKLSTKQTKAQPKIKTSDNCTEKILSYKISFEDRWATNRRKWNTYNSSYPMMSGPMKTLELHYPVIQFLLIANVQGMIKLLATDKNDITWLASIFLFLFHFQKNVLY